MHLNSVNIFYKPYLYVLYLCQLKLTHISHDKNNSFYLIQKSICRLILTIFYRWVNISHRPLVDLMCFNDLFYVYFKRFWIYFFPLSFSKCTAGLKGIIRVHHGSHKKEKFTEDVKIGTWIFTYFCDTNKLVYTIKSV